MAHGVCVSGVIQPRATNEGENLLIATNGIRKVKLTVRMVCSLTFYLERREETQGNPGSFSGTD
jgi:hypothetical protein